MIEFAFVVPVFLALIYYAHDLPKMKRWHRKTQFVANEIAMILQNLAAQRTKEGKKITANDIRLAVRMAGLSIFPGITQYSLSSFKKMPLGYMGLIIIYYVVGGASGSARVKWWYRIHPDAGAAEGYALNRNQTDRANDRLVNTNGTTAKAIYSGLKISDGEVKIIVEYALHTFDSIISASGKGNSSPGKVFGFLFYRPSAVICNYFRRVAIFTPQGNAFTETIPQ